VSHISEQPPEFVLRSRYVQLRALFALAAITVLCLIAAVVVLAIEDDGTSSATFDTTPAMTVPHDTMSVAPGTRYDHGPEEGTRGARAVTPPAGTRYDGGPDEGTRVPNFASPSADTRYDGGPNEGSRGPGR
jgi:hypothetical protein